MLDTPTSTRTPVETSLLGDGCGSLVLRVCAGPQAGRVMRLSAGKCTIGSAPHCTLRLHGPGIEPVQCLVVNGRRQSIVRRWSAGVRLNDRAFDDCALEPGDRLTLGAVELQVLELPQQPTEPTRAARRLDHELAQCRERLTSLESRLELANRQGRRRLRAAITKLRKSQLRLSDLDARRALFTEEQRRLADEGRNLERRESEVQALLAETARRRESLAAEERTLTTQAERLREASVRWNRDRHTAEQDINARRIQLAAELDRVSDQRRHIDEEQVRLERQTDELRRREAKLADESKSLDARLAQLDNQREGLEQLERRLCERSEEARRRAEQTAERETALERREAEINRDRAAREAAWSAREAALVEREQAAEQRLAEIETLREKVQAEAVEVSRSSARAEGLTRDEARLRDTAAQLNADLRRLEEQRAALESQRAALEADRDRRETSWTDRRDDLARREAELQARIAAHDAVRSEWERTAEAKRREAAEHEAQLAARAEAVEQRHAEIERQTADVARRCELLKRNWTELCDRENRLERQTAEAAQRQAAGHSETAAASAEAETARRELAAVKDELQAVRVVTETAQLELTDARAELQRSRVVAETAQAELQTARNELTANEGRLQKHAAESQTSAAHGAELEAELAATKAALAEVQSALAEIKSELADAASHQDEIAQQLKSITAQRDAAVAERDETHRDLELALTELHALQSSPPAARAVEPTPVAASLTPTVRQVVDETNSVDAEETEAEQEESIEDGTIDAALSAPAEGDAEQEETAPPAPSESAADVLRRMGLSAALDEVTPPQPAARAPGMGLRASMNLPQPAPIERAPEPARPAAGAGHEQNEGELDAYMSQLFARLGVKQSPTAPTNESKPAREESASRAAATSEAKPVPAVPAVSQAPLEAGEFKARSVAAERGCDLSAMREIANLSARTAIQKHEIRSAVDTSKLRMIGAALSAGAAATGAWVWLVQDQMWGAALLVAAIGSTSYCLVQSAKMNVSVRKKSRSLDDVIRGTTAKMNEQPAESAE